MADNVTVNPGVLVGTRQESGAGDQIQRVIPQTYSTPGSSGGTVLDVGASNPLPIDNVEIPGPATLVDATANPSTGLLGTLPALYNGTTWDRARSASAANQSAFSGIGALKMAKIGCWTVVSPTGALSANVQGSASKAAGGVGVRHICTGIYATIQAGTTAPAAIQLVLNLIDGVTGGTTYLWRSVVVIPATISASQSFNISDVAIVGSANTAMTLEFSAAGGANMFETVTLMGYDVS